MSEEKADHETVVLRALGSPVRQQILDLLARGPATSAMLARSLSSNTGVMSYHLRELGKAGLIERDAQKGRSLYWRLAEVDVRFGDPQLSPQPALAEAVIDLTLARQHASVTGYLRRTDLEPAWRDAALFSQSALTLTVTELAELSAEYLALVRRWTGSRPVSTAARPVRLAMFAYPDDEPLVEQDDVTAP